jgi:hypothetical protein
MKIIKDSIGILVGVPIVGATLNSIGSNLTGSLKGIGDATQALVAGGFLGHTAGKVKGWFK